MHHLYDYMYTLGFEPNTLVATGTNCTESFLMVEGLCYNAAITCLMEDQNTNEPVVMWTLS
jgi:hypothetical protein